MLQLSWMATGDLLPNSGLTTSGATVWATARCNGTAIAIMTDPEKLGRTEIQSLLTFITSSSWD